VPRWGLPAWAKLSHQSDLFYGLRIIRCHRPQSIGIGVWSPPLPNGYCRFQASDNSTHEIPRKHLAQARRIDPGLVLLKERAVMNSQGRGSSAGSMVRVKFTRAERDVLRTLYFAVFAS
jgi:hypothetical protein